MMGIAGVVLEPYEGDLDEAANNPLHLEQTATLPDDLVFLNFQDTENVIGDWFNQALKEADTLLGSMVPDTDGPNTDKRDLGINVLMRSHLLDEDRALFVDIANLPMDAVLFKGHDQITETTISLNSVKVMGLDTLDRFNPLTDIGKLTLQNELTWRSLTLEFDVTVDVMPSSREDAILQDSTSSGISERITIDFGVENTDVVASLFLAIDQAALGTLELGSLLTLENVLPCILSVVHRLELSGLSVEPQSVKVPSLKGFVSPGIDRIVTNSVRAAFAMYMGVLRQAIPNIFQTSIRDFVNSELIGAFFSDNSGAFFSDNSGADCPEVQEVSGFLDFRDLLLTPEAAKNQGGTGLAPYGDIAYKVKGMIEDNLLSVEEDGLVKLNSFLVRPATESQSGIPGTISILSQPLLHEMTEFANKYVHSFVDRFQIGLLSARINNLDTIRPPVRILETRNEPHSLANSLYMGPVPTRPINLTAGFILSLDGDRSPLSMYHELNLGLSISAAAFEANLFANVDTSRFLHFPLKDVLIPECWLALVPAPTASGPNFSFDDIAIIFDSLDFGIDVISTTSLGLDILPELFQLLKSTGGVDFLKSRGAEYVEDFLEKDKIQKQIDLLLANAPMLCPHSPEYNKEEVSRETGTVPFPDFSPRTVDAIFYSATVVAEMAFVAFLESHRLETREQTFALSAQDAVSAQNSFFDFSKLEGDIGQLLDLGLSEARSYLTGTVESSSEAFPDLKMNVIIRDWLLKGNKNYKLQFDESFEFNGVKIEILSLTFGGLDSLTDFSIWDVIAPQTIQNKMAWDSLSIKLDLRATDSLTMKSIQNFSMSLSLGSVRAEIPIFLALNKDRLQSLSLGSLLQTENILGCLLSAVDSIKMTQMKVSFDAFDQPRIEGLLADSNGFIQEFTDKLMASHEEMINSTLPIVIDSTLRKLLNNLADTYLTTFECTQGLVASGLDDFVDFRDLLLPSEVALATGATGMSPYGDAFRHIFDYVQDLVTEVDPTTGQLAVNDAIISKLTETHSGSETSLLFPGELFSGGSRVQVGGLDAKIKMRASQARIENVDTVGSPLTLLYPVLDQGNVLNNTAVLGAADRPLRFAVRFLLSLIGDDDMQLQNDVEISLDMYSLSMILQMMFNISETRFRNFLLGDILDFNCWLATIPAPTLDIYGIRADGVEPTTELRKIVASVANLNLHVSCIECSSPGMRELTRLLSTSEAQEDLTETANSLLAYITELIGGNYLQVQIDRLLNEASRKCPHSPEFDPDATVVQYESIPAPDNDISISFLLMLAAVAGSIVLATLLLTLSIKCFVKRRHKNWLKSLPNLQVHRLVLDQERERKEASNLSATTQSMFTSPEIPLAVRLIMPFIILANIGLFVSGHLSLGATVNIEAKLAGEKISVEKFFEFSMAKSTIDIWNAGGKELAILILLFSGIWPYTKQLITLALWFMPPTRCSVTRRESILLWLDCLGKWSMIDIFVLVISIAAFRLSIVSPNKVFLPEDFYSVDLLVVPLWGLYANMIAQLVSQVSSHFIIHYHRRIINGAIAQTTHKESASVDDSPDCTTADSSIGGGSVVAKSDEDSRIALHKHTYGRPHRGESDKLVVKPWVNKALLLFTVCLVGCIVVGSSVPSFSLEILGIIGLAVESGQDFQDAATHHSIFTVIELFFEEARFLDTVGDYIGLGTLSVLFVFTVLLVPLLQSLALLKQWFSASTKAEKEKMSIIIEILQAWQYAEVYLIAIFVASWQLGPISEFMINSYCTSLKNTLGELVYYGMLKADDAQCFSVKSTIESGSYILAIGAVLLALLNSFVSKAVRQYFRDKKEERNLLMGHGAEFQIRDSDAESDSTSVDKTPRPVPVLFTDTFRWMLIRDDSRIGSNSFFAAFGYHKVNSRRSQSSAGPISPILRDEDIDDIEQISQSSGSDGSDSKVDQQDISQRSGSDGSDSKADQQDDIFDDESGWSSIEESTHHSDCLP